MRNAGAVGDAVKGFAASSAVSRPNAYAVPCSVLVPDFRPRLTIEYLLFQPYSALGILLGVELLNGINGQPRLVLESRARAVARIKNTVAGGSGKRGDAVDEVEDRRPSAGRWCWTFLYSPPMLALRQRPGAVAARRWKLRPFRGRAFITEFSTVPPRVASVVSTAGASDVTVTVWVCAPGVSVEVNPGIYADLDHNVGMLDDLKASSLSADPCRFREAGFSATYSPALSR